MEVIILAGGMGTRLQGVVSDVPKPMAPIRNQPFLNYLLEWVVAYPISKIVFSVGYKADVIKDYYGESFNNIPISYAEEQEPLGTGGAIFNALQYTSEKNILIVNGDTYFPIELDVFFQFHTAANNSFSIALKEMEYFDRYGTVELVKDTIKRFKEKKPLKKGLINGGIYLIRRDFLETKLLPAKFSLEQDILEKEALNGNLKAMVFTSTFIDIGVPSDYQKALDQL